jgi:hypothetical protein
MVQLTNLCDSGIANQMSPSIASFDSPIRREPSARRGIDLTAYAKRAEKGRRLAG